MPTGFNGLLTATVFLPAVAALLLALGILRDDRAIRWYAGAVALADLVLSVIVFVLFTPGGDRFQLVDRFDWIDTGTVQASYLLGVDGISAPLVMLTGLLGLCAVFVSFHIHDRVKEYFIWLFVLQTAVMGVFTSLDFLLFFLFWEIELVPMYLLISTWGTGRREYSAMKFLIFTILGSAFMLVAIVAVFVSSGVGSFDMTRLLEPGGALDASRAALPMGVLFWLFFIAFRGEIADVAGAHLVARRAYGRTDGRQCHAGRRNAKDGRIRVVEGERRDVPGATRQLCVTHRGIGSGERAVRSGGDAASDGPETVDCVFQREPHGPGVGGDRFRRGDWWNTH